MLNHPAAKKSNLFKINKNKKYVLQHKIEDNRIKKQSSCTLHIQG